MLTASLNCAGLCLAQRNVCGLCRSPLCAETAQTTQRPSLAHSPDPTKSASGRTSMACTQQTRGRFQKPCAWNPSRIMRRGSSRTLEPMCYIHVQLFLLCAMTSLWSSATSLTLQLLAHALCSWTSYHTRTSRCPCLDLQPLRMWPS
jgi:hypothetical protein